MGKKLEEIMNEASELNVRIKQLLYHAEYENDNELSYLTYDKTDPQQLFILDELRMILDRLDDVSHTMNYLDRAVKDVGELHKNSNGRMELNGHEFRSGDGIEYLSCDERHCTYNTENEYVPVAYWKSGTVEHNGSDYYIAGASDLTLEGLVVRYR